MLEIKTIWCEIRNSDIFDDDVNKVLAEGWELVRREVLPRRVETGDTLLYAELERYIEELQEEEQEDDGLARWVFSRRNPLEPYHCSACGYAADPSKALPSLCPNCQRRTELMTMRGLD